MKFLLRAALGCALLLDVSVALAGGGPLGIDHKLPYDDSGIWRRSNQLALEDLTIAAVLGGSLWEGGESRIGNTFWRSLDASALGAVSSQALKYAFTRSRPSQTDSPDQWFQGKGHYSFPSGEVTLISSAITPFVLEYGPEQPAVYALEVLPVYDAVARMKVHGHWQTDVLAGWAIGTASGYYAQHRDSPFFLELLPGGFEAGLKTRF
ncbi:MAG: phosphatase PAP2 family protein [Sphingomonadaceae bacterium]